MYKMKLTLGDWSGDGHSISKTYICSSNKPVEDVREAHFKFEDLFGFEIGSLCQEYGESWLSKDIYYKLQDILKWDDDEGLTEDWWDENDNRYHTEPDELVWIWIKCLEAADNELTLKIVDDSIPSLHFYGVDSASRHLHTPGYGLFE